MSQLKQSKSSFLFQTLRVGWCTSALVRLNLLSSVYQQAMYYVTMQGHPDLNLNKIFISVFCLLFSSSSLDAILIQEDCKNCLISSFVRIPTNVDIHNVDISMHKCGLRLEKDITHKSTQHKVSHTFLLLLSQLIYNIGAHSF